MSDPLSRALHAYANNARSTADPRRLEAGVLLKASQQLEAVRRLWADGGEAALEAALLYNRKLWTVFAAEMAEDSCPLPLEIRNNIANLAVFVFKRTFEVQAAADPDKLAALIHINNQIAAGLLAGPAQDTLGPAPEPAAAETPLQAAVNA
jgi:flagellar protein FlaF